MTKHAVYFVPKDCEKCGCLYDNVRLTYKQKFFFDIENSRGIGSVIEEDGTLYSIGWKFTITKIEDELLKAPVCDPNLIIKEYQDYLDYENQLPDYGKVSIVKEYEEEKSPNNFYKKRYKQISLTSPESVYRAIFLGSQDYFECECGRCSFKWIEYPYEPDMYNLEVAQKWIEWNKAVEISFNTKKAEILSRPRTLRVVGPTEPPKGFWNHLFS
jgi:hypothetical protein